MRFIAGCPELFSCPLLIGYGIAGSCAINRIPFISPACWVATSRFGLEHSRPHALGIIAFQVLHQENPATIDKVKAVLEKHPWYANQWQARLQDVPIADHGLVLFVQAARWADDIRIRDKAQNRSPWHYINFPFKPEGQLATVQIREPEPVNILTALAENESIVKSGKDERRAIALAWLFHLLGRGDYLQLEPDTVTKRGNGPPKTPRVSAE